MSNKFQRGSRAHWPSPPLSFSYSCSMSLYLFSLSLVILLSFSFPPLNQSYNNPTAADDKKKFEGELLLIISLLPSPSLTVSLSFLSLLFFFSFSPPPPSYIGFISTICLFIFSLSLVLLLSFFNINLCSYGQLLSLFFTLVASQSPEVGL